MQNTQCLKAEFYLLINLVLQSITFLASDEIFFPHGISHEGS